MSEKNEKEIIEKSNEAWRQLSAWWDDDIKDGDPFHRYLVFPGMLELVNAQPGKRILDVGCGNGTLTRRLAASGAAVMGVDVSETFVEQAAKRSGSAISYEILDATSDEELAKLTSLEDFDSVVCSMALHDIPTISPLLNALPALMNKNGSFVFSIPHPCFNMGELTLDFFSDNPSVSRSKYIKREHLLMKSKRDQPISQHCFHLSISDLFSQLFAAGLVLDGLKEPSISSVKEDMSQVDLDWRILSEIPPVLICRWVLK